MTASTVDPATGNGMPAASTWHDILDVGSVTPPAIAGDAGLNRDKRNTSASARSSRQAGPRVRRQICLKVPVIYHLRVRLPARERARAPQNAWWTSR